MVIPEHAQVSDTDGRHEGTNHLVELASRGTQNAPERRVPHVEEGFYGSLDRSSRAPSNQHPRSYPSE